MSKTVEVDTKTFVRFWLVILGFILVTLFVWKALTGLIVVGAAIFLAIAIRPLVQKVQSIDKTPKEGAIWPTVIAFSIVIVVILGAIAIIGPVVVSQTSSFVSSLPQTFQDTLGGWDGVNDFGRTIGIENLQDELTSGLENFSSNFLSNFGNTFLTSVGAIGGFLGQALMVIVLTLLFLLDGPTLWKKFWKMLGGKKEDSKIDEWRRVFARMANVISTYVSNQVTVSILDGVSTAIVVAILSIFFGFSAGLAFPMGMIAMIFCLIPMFGQVIGCVLVSLILLFNAPIAGIIFAVFYIVYAQIENNVIAPKIQGSSLSLSPVVILSAITIGTYMLGLIGAIISIPVAGCLKVLFEEYPRIKELREK